MRDYAMVSPRFWIGHSGRELRSAGADAQVVALYLLSSPHANMLGLYYLPIAYIAHETGLTAGAARAALAKVIELGFCAYDDAAEVVWVHEMARFQIGEQLEPADKRCKGVQKEYLHLPANRLLPAFFDRHAGRFHLTTKRGDKAAIDTSAQKPHQRASEAPSKPLRSQEQEQEQEQDLPSASAEGAAGGAVPLASVPKVPDCPHEQLIALYHEVLPTCSRVREWTDQRKGYLRARWREKAKPNGSTQGYKTVEEGLAWWRKFFGYVGESQFLIGRTAARGDRQPFVADFEWLIRPSNFAKIVEGKYHDAAA